MTDLLCPPQVIETLRRVQAFAAARGQTYYLVGGWLRDQLLGRRPSYLNVDLAVAHGAMEEARCLAAQLQGAFVPLDDTEGVARVVCTVPVVAGAQRGPSGPSGVSGLGARPQRIELDLSDFRGPSLEADLAKRDFTINAIAMELGRWLEQPDNPRAFIDPLRGRQALTQQRIIACFPETFQADPVRILRAVRFAAQLGFAMEASLPGRMSAAAAALAQVSGERIRDELIAICETDRAGEAMVTLNTVGCLDVVFPELARGRGMVQGGVHHLDVLDHQLEAVRQADRILADFQEFSATLRGPLTAYRDEQLVERRSRKSLMKLAVLIHDVGKPAKRQVHPDGEIWFIGHEHTGAELAASMVERLRLANREAELVTQLVRHHLRPGFLSREPELTRRAIYRFYKDLGDHGPACGLMWWADRMATRGPRSRLDQLDQQRHRLEELLTPYFIKPEEIVAPLRLVDGHQLMRAFSLSPGPRVGALLAVIEEAQAEGRVHTVEEAMALAEAYMKQHNAE